MATQILFQCCAAVEHQGAVEEQNVLSLELQESAQHTAVHISDVHQGHALVILHQQGGQ